MKIRGLIILFALLTEQVLAQDFIYATGQHRIDTILNENYESYEIQITTPTPENITFKWQLLSNTFNSNWSCSVCDYSGCYVGFPSSATMTAITSSDMVNGTYGFIKCNITCGAYYGDGKVEIYVYDQNDYNRGDTISFSIHWPSPSLVQEKQISFTAYPNPVKDQLTFLNNSSIKGVFSVVDILGATTLTGKVNAKAECNLNFADLPKGVYLVSLRTDNGSSSTKKIIKK